MVQFKPAEKKSCKLRCAVFGPSGAGKTMSALRIATGIGGRIAVIDTEFGSASKYADRFQFDTVSLERPSIDDYIEAMIAAQGYDVLVIDSLSHGWQELLEEIDNLAKAKYKGNTWSAWNEGSPKQKKLVKFINSFPGHVIATMRSKTEWQVEQNQNGKSRPVRVGLSPEQGKGIEYEFDMLIELSVDHICNVIKDRTGKFQDVIIEKPGEQFGKDLVAWLNDGTSQAPNNSPYNQQSAPAQTQNNFKQDFYNQPQQQQTPPPPQQDTPPQNNFKVPPFKNPATEPIINALCDFYASQQTENFKFNREKLLWAIWQNFGGWPTKENATFAIKQKISFMDVCDDVKAA